MKVRKFTTGLLPVIGVCIGVAILVFALAQSWYIKGAINDQDRLTRILAKNKGDEYFNAKIDLYNRRADDTRSLLVYLLAIGGFITTLQGLFAYFNVQNYLKQADDAIKKADEAMNKLDAFRISAEDSVLRAREALDAIKEATPVFAQLDLVINKAVDQLHAFFKESDTITEVYITIPPLERQRITYYERSIAGLEVIDVPSINQKLANIFRGLSIFYASKYFDEKQLFESQKDSGSPPVYFKNKDDLNRAKIYAEIAKKKTEYLFCIESDLGWIAYQEGERRKAEDHFKRSLALQPHQQRALTNLGIIHLESRDLDNAETHLREAKGYTLWEFSRDDLKSKPCFNLACVLALKAARPGISEAAKESCLAAAYEELVEMLRYDVEGVRLYYKNDIAQGGDLFLLASHPNYAGRMKDITAQMLF